MSFEYAIYTSAYFAIGVLALLFLANVALVLARIFGNKKLAERIEHVGAPIAHMFRVGTFSKKLGSTTTQVPN